MLDLSLLTRALGAEACRFDVDLLPVCESTNAVLLSRAEMGAASGSIVVAATQTAGRGRRGRSWVSAPGDSLTFSLLWRFAPGIAPAGLSLVVGVAVAAALAKVSCCETALKWPNDVLKDGKKLAGILIELLPGAPHVAVIGIGLNLRLPASLPDEIRATAAALEQSVDVAVLLAALLVELRAVMERFSLSGFVGLRDAWSARHVYQDVPVRLLSDFAPPRDGICRGVDVDGALLFESAGKIERILSGEISLRAAP